ncbi:MAG: family 16 glycosylhydrolase [Hyphomonadaceae bacterium]
MPASPCSSRARTGRPRRRSAPAETPETPETPEAPASSPAAAAPAGPPPPPGQIGEAFVDRFDGPELDPRWNVSDGWSNGAWIDSDWRKEQVRLTPAGLEIVMEKSPPGREKAFASGEVQSRDVYRYGYFETRMKMPKAKGISVAAFTFAPRMARGKSQEIDIELTGRDPRSVELTIHLDSKTDHARLQLPFDASQGFHTYGFEWLPDRVRWYADGEMIYEDAGSKAARLDEPQLFIFMLWGARKLEPWLGKLDMNGGPWTYTIACAAYQPVYTGVSPCAAEADGLQTPA